MTEENSKKYRYEATKRLLIDLLKTASGLTILLARPSGSMYNPKYFFKNNEFDRTKFRRTIRHAKNSGYVDVKEKNGEVTITLKEEGKTRALKYAVEDISIPDQVIWDKKWRLVIFDIPEELKHARNIFKAKLDQLGFAQIQKSTYVYPYPCHNEIEYIRSLFNLQSYIRIGLLEKLENDQGLRKRFSL